jgi:predicted GNAT family acetyltransferase
MQITNNKKEFKFEALLEDGEKATLEYRWLKGSMVLMHTLVPVSGRGKGVGAALVKYVLDYARNNNLKIIVYCQFVTKYMGSHPEYNDLLDEAHRK